MKIRHGGRYGVLAEFATPEALVVAAKAVWARGYRKLDAFTPFAVEELDEVLQIERREVSLLVLIGGIVGCACGFMLQYYLSVQNYPLNVGGRPLNSWPSFIPVTFEVTVLIAGLTAMFGMFALNGLPMPYHPVFSVPRFALASRDRFFLCIEAEDPLFDADETPALLRSLHAYEVTDVDWPA